MAMEPGSTTKPSPPSPSEALRLEAEASLRIEHWRDGEHRSARPGSRRSTTRSASRAPATGSTSPIRRRRSSRRSPRELGLHPLIAEDILERNQRPKLELTDGFAHLVVFAVAWERELLVEEIDIVLGSTVPPDGPHDVLGPPPRAAPSRRGGARPRPGHRLPPVGAPRLRRRRLLPGLRPDRGRDRRPRGPDRRAGRTATRSSSSSPSSASSSSCATSARRSARSSTS